MTNIMDLLKRRVPLAKSFRPASEASADCLALWRPAWEVGPVLWHLTASAFALGLWSYEVLSGFPALALGGIPAGLALKRITEAQRIWKERSRLSGHAPAFMSFADLALVMRSFETPRLSPDEPRSAIRQTGLTRAAAIRLIGADPGTLFHAPAEAPVQSVWFGLGFRWTPVEAQRFYELTRIDWKSMLLPERWRHWFSRHPGLSDASPGIPVLHGVGPSPVCPPWQRGRKEEEPGIIRSLSSLGGGTLLVGTTQTGKGVVLTNLMSQAILRGDAVIVIDPKSSKRLRSAVIGACRAAGRPEPLEFHPAFPKRGVRLNPLESYTRSTEIASRICAVLPRGDGAFTAFAWRAVFVMTEGMLFAGQPPTLRRFRAALERGIEELLEAALRKDLSKRVPFWEERLEAIVLQQSREIRVPMGAGGGMEIAAMAALWERTAGCSGSKYCPETPEAAIEGLLSVYRHSREHYAKITASLLPALSMLTAGTLGESLSPECDLSGKTDDPRPIVSLEDVISMQGVLYLGLDALPDAETASALGALLLSDLSGAAGRRYNTEASGQEAVRTSLFVDETANVINPPLIEILNKGMEAGFQCVCAMQTISDLEARLGSAAQARMALGNLNNLIALRTKDEATQKFIAEAFGRTTIWETAASVTTTAGASALPAFRAAASSSLSGRRDSVVPLEALGQLPNLEFFASLSGGRLWKGRMPILDPALEGLHLYAPVKKSPAPIGRLRAFLEACGKCLKSGRSAALRRQFNGENGDRLK